MNVCISVCMCVQCMDIPAYNAMRRLTSEGAGEHTTQLEALCTHSELGMHMLFAQHMLTGCVHGCTAIRQ
jgi:hypothetical protein